MAFILAFLVVGLTVGLRHTPETDEIRYHLPATLQYMEQFPHLDLRNYQSASGPLPYVIFMFWARAFGANIVSLRVAVMLFGLLTLLVAWALLEGEKLSTRVLITLLLFLHPYFLFRSFSLYTVVPALFFGLLSLLMLRKYEANHPRYFFLLAYVICSTAAVTSRQVYLSYALGVPLFAMASRLPRVRNLFSHGVRHSYGSVVLMIVPVLILGLLVLHWGGLTPPMFASYNYSGVNFAHVDFMLVFLGFWFWPLCLDNLKRVPKWVYLVAALAAVHLIWTPLPLYKADPKESYLGVIGAVYTWLAGLNLPLLLLKTSQIVLWVLGVVILVLLGQQRDEPYALISLVHFVIMLSVPFVWERYYFAAFPTVWLALRRDVRDPRLYIPLVLQQAGLSVQYFTTHS
jgi:hypothetical protein